MSSWIAVSRLEHAQSHWRPLQGFGFAAELQVVEVLAAELSSLLPHYVLGFVLKNDNYQLVALLGLGTTGNFYVSGENKWTCSVVPAALRGHPFKILNSEDGEQVFCIDQEHLTEDSNDVPMFDEKGDLASSTQKVLDFLTSCYSNRKLTQTACDTLAQAKVIQPWPLRINKPGDDESVPVEGLYRVDEAALNSISRTTLAGLRGSGALAVAYAQLFSLNQLNQLSQRSEILGRQKAEIESKSNLSGIFEDEGSLSFDGL